MACHKSHGRCYCKGRKGSAPASRCGGKARRGTKKHHVKHKPCSVGRGTGLEWSADRTKCFRVSPKTGHKVRVRGMCCASRQAKATHAMGRSR